MNRSLPRLEFEKERQSKGLCVVCETKLTGRRTVFCSDECCRIYWKRHDWQSFRARVFSERNYTCERCGNKHYGSYGLVLDHIIPLALGGRLMKKSNVQVLCSKCNKIKTASDLREIAEFKKRKGVVDMRPFWNLVETYIPQLDEYWSYQNE